MIKSNNEWAEKQSGHAKLGDPRRTSRLVKIASDLALYPGKSVVKSSPSPASMEGAYRFIRNENVSSDDIAEAGFNATVNQGHHYLLLLAIEDTTSMISEIGSGHSSKMTDSLPHGVGPALKQNSTGGKSSLGALSKNGNREFEGITHFMALEQ